MAETLAIPLLERLRCVCIVSSNLDEFFEIRVSSLKQQLLQNPGLISLDGLTPGEAFQHVQEAAHKLVARQYALLNEEILPQLRAEGIGLHFVSDWDAQQQEWAHELFNREVMPLLTPIGLDPAHPFPRVYNKSLNFIVSLAGADAFGRQASIAVVQAPRALPRLIKMPPAVSGHPHGYVFLTTLMRAFVGDLFPGLEMRGCYPWRVTRNSDLFVDEEEVTNLRLALQGELSQRNFGAASFQPVIDFLTAAALDPDVMAIKQTIYRTGEDSELMQILLAAARAGKEVTVVVELMARFDEQTNINWAAKLEEVGAHVVYGVVGRKTHAKMAVVLRHEQGRLRRYAHLSTGNYHPRTARRYTDFGLLTAHPQLCEDMDLVFAQLTGLGARRTLKCLIQSPFTLHEEMITLIGAEARAARAGKRAHIMAKMNSLLERQVIEALYQASQAGVKIDLIVRGVCALRAGVQGLSDNIRVRSLVGRFLEHARVFYFCAEGKETVYLSSADWMDRNFFRRVEIAFPIMDKTLKQRIVTEAFTYALKDNQLAWQQLPNGDYQRVRKRQKPFNSHTFLMSKLGACETPPPDVD
eukprot:scaffold57.g4552.t1